MPFRRRIIRLLHVSGLIALFSVAGLAQENLGGRSGVELPRQNDDATNKGSIRGRVVTPGEKFVPENLKVSLLTFRGVQSVVFTDARGGFDFTDLPPGNSEFQAETNGVEYQAVTQNVQVFKGPPALIPVTLAEKTTGAAARVGT